MVKLCAPTEEFVIDVVSATMFEQQFHYMGFVSRQTESERERIRTTRSHTHSHTQSHIVCVRAWGHVCNLRCFDAVPFWPINIFAVAVASAFFSASASYE